LSAPLNLDMATYLRYFDRPMPGAHLERLGVMARVLIGTLLNQPTRPWGLVTELAATFETSRETLYTIAARVRAGVLVRPKGRRPIELKVPEVLPTSAYPHVTVTPNRVERTVLTNLLPGGMTLRHQLDSLHTALDTRRSEGWISALIRDAGRAQVGRD